MTQYIYLAIFLVGLLSGAAPVRFYYEAKEDARELALASDRLEQEKKNVALVTSYQDAIVSMADWFRKHPTRVFVPGTKECPGGSSPAATDVVLTVGGVKTGNSAATN